MEKENKELIHRTIWYFFIFSVIGLIIETIYCYITTGVLESRKGLLWGPFCPIYGVGAAILILILGEKEYPIIKLFIYGIIIGSLLEYILSYGMEAIYSTRFWDYTYTNMDINGRICISYSIMWGILAIFVIKIIKPPIDRMIGKMELKTRNRLEVLLVIFLIFDVLCTFCAITVYKERAIKKYNGIETEIKNEYKLIKNERMLKTFPNLRIKGNNGEEVWIRDVLFEDK